MAKSYKDLAEAERVLKSILNSKYQKYFLGAYSNIINEEFNEKGLPLSKDLRESVQKIIEENKGMEIQGDYERDYQDFKEALEKNKEIIAMGKPTPDNFIIPGRGAASFIRGRRSEIPEEVIDLADAYRKNPSMKLSDKNKGLLNAYFKGRLKRCVYGENSTIGIDTIKYLANLGGIDNEVKSNLQKLIEFEKEYISKQPDQNTSDTDYTDLLRLQKRISPKNLEKGVMAGIALIGIIGGLILISSKITGFVITNKISNNYSLIGITLLVIGIFAGINFLKI